MSTFNREELRAIMSIVTEEGLTATWDKNQAIAVTQTIEDWFESNTSSLLTAMEETVPGILSDEAKAGFIKAYMQIKAIGPPKKRLVPEYYDDTHEVNQELNDQTDRGIAIVGAAFLDAKLEMALKVYFVEGLSNNDYKDLFDGPVTPLGTFSAKVRVARAVGLIGAKTFNDLKLINTIRNRFAHELSITSFNEPSIAELCAKLQLTEIGFMGRKSPLESRTMFIHSVLLIMNLLYSEIVAGSDIGELPKMSP